MIKVVFFDLDETLITALPCHRLANIEAFAAFGYDYMKLRKPTADSQTQGLRVIDFLKIRKEGAGITEERLPLQKLYEKRQQILMQHLKEYAKLLPGAIHALKNAKENHCTVGIVSSGTKEYILKLMELFHLEPYVDFFVSGEDVNVGKPDPESYKKAFSKLQAISPTEKNECLAVEDAVIGVQSAKSAGFKVLLVPNKIDKNELKSKPDYIISTLEKFDLSTLNSTEIV